jgi:hypothetical protein
MLKGVEDFRRKKGVELFNLFGLFLGLHLLFTADDVTGIDASTDLIHCNSKATNSALISIALFHTFL